MNKQDLLNSIEQYALLDRVYSKIMSKVDLSTPEKALLKDLFNPEIEKHLDSIITIAKAIKQEHEIINSVTISLAADKKSDIIFALKNNNLVSNTLKGVKAVIDDFYNKRVNSITISRDKIGNLTNFLSELQQRQIGYILN